MATLLAWLRTWAPRTAIAAAILVTGWCLWAKGDDTPVWQWAETNQGLLSILALSIALAFALIENHRANSASRVAKNEYIDMIVAVIDQSISHANDLSGFLKAARPASDQIPHYI
jgi:hypothetical protein